MRRLYASLEEPEIRVKQTRPGGRALETEMQG